VSHLLRPGTLGKLFVAGAVATTNQTNGSIPHHWEAESAVAAGSLRCHICIPVGGEGDARLRCCLNDCLSLLEAGELDDSADGLTEEFIKTLVTETHPILRFQAANWF